MSDKQSPLKDPPLRVPGQSVDDELDDVLYDRLLTPFAVALFAVAMAALEWFRTFHPQPPEPLVYTLAAVVALCYAAWSLRRAWPKVKALRLARSGERAVGQYLERLREQGYRVFHDVIGRGFNVDHVLVGPGGIYTVETKTFRKRKGAKVHFDGQRLTIDGVNLDRDPLIQARSQASWLRAVLSESTGRKFNVKPVVLFPGWFIDSPKGALRDIWVLEPKALPEFLENQVACLPKEDVQLAAYHLSRYIRSQVAA
jgi:hypothetical protein